MNRRRMLSSVHRRMARQQSQGLNAVAWFNGQSFHQSAADMPFERIPTKELDKAGAALLPKCAYGCGQTVSAEHAPFCSSTCSINAENS